ncbi:MAG TPA: AAA family ATPase [Chloroflexota bacterium]|nr:AAA family ATPase [Chloroflexota bacterium]
MSQAGPAHQTLAAAQVRTFLIADLRGYTGYTLEHGDEAAAQLASRFADLAAAVVTTHSGRVIELRGDEALAVFDSARQALRAAVEIQARVTLEGDAWPVKVGIGLDAGEAVTVQDGYRGAALNLAARLCSLAGPGEVMASDGVVHLARRVDGLSYVERGLAQLKGFAEPVRVVEVVRQNPDGASVPRTAGTAPQRRLPIGGFLGALPPGLMVGRHAELSRILGAVEVVAGGTGQLLLLAGEPGVGKTRLAQEVCVALRDRGFVVGVGRCYEAQAAVPYYPFVEALAEIHAAAPDAIRAETGRRWSYLGQLLPDHVGTHLAASGNPEDQQRLFWSITGFVQAIGAGTPVAFLIDDMHWADGTSLELLQHLARATRGDRILLLGTYRDVDVGRQHPLEAALRDLNREGLADRIEVRRLDEGGTAELIAETMGEDEISSEFAGLLYRRTEGNAFFVQQVLRVLVERGDVYRENGAWQRKAVEEIEVPESVRSVIGQRLSRLSQTSQETLREASVLGQTFLDPAGLLAVFGRRGYQYDSLVPGSERMVDAIEP